MLFDAGSFMVALKLAGALSMYCIYIYCLFVEPALPYFLSFAAGAMIYVVVEELIPEMSEGNHSNLGTIFYAVGFSAMIILDVTLQ